MIFVGSDCELGSEAKNPKLNRLGGSEWTKTRAKVKGAVQEIAKDLVKLYAARQEQKGFQYGSDTVWQKEFEEPTSTNLAFVFDTVID